MADTILILGNGFDIAMGRKTKYEEFLEFSNNLNSRKKYIISFRKYIKQYKRIKLSTYKENLYLKFINENRNSFGDNWSNLEIMISHLVDAIMYFKNNMHDLFYNSRNELNKDHLTALKIKLQKSNNASAKIFVVDKFVELYLKKNWKLLQREEIWKELNLEFITQLDLLIELLEIYLSYLDYLDFEISKIKAKPTALDAVPHLLSSYVLNFNYTNTSGYLFGTSEERTHFIHGRIDLDRTFS